MPSLSKLITGHKVGNDADEKPGQNAARKTRSSDACSITRVDPDLFHLPVQRLGVSGGTAPFFQLKLKCPRDDGGSIDYYIGKDVKHASDEVDFYEKMAVLKRNPGSNESLLPLLDFACQYAGVLTAPEDGFEDLDASRDLLVLRNLRDGIASLRFMDIKMGKKTAQAGWHGKTLLHALKQDMLDSFSNSSSEGFRVEGFDGCPDSLASKEPLMDVISLGHIAIVKEKMNRFMLQHMRGKEAFRAFVDLNGSTINKDDENNCYEPCEIAEIILHEVVERLVRLLLACYKVHVPQKWVGSSVALGFDAAYFPRRGRKSEENIRSKTLVRIFDWGRSELNTAETFDRMTPAEKEDRRKFWKFYIDGIKSLSWYAAKEYWRRYCNPHSWGEIQICVFDYDSTSADDFMCQATVPVVETTKTWIPLKGRVLKKVFGTLSYSVEWLDAPSPESRFKGWFRLHIGEGKDLPIKDRFRGASDPYCVITARSLSGKHKFIQVTSTIPQNLNPTWNESFDLPIPRDFNELANAISNAFGYDVSTLSSRTLNSFFETDSSGPEGWGDLLRSVK